MTPPKRRGFHIYKFTDETSAHDPKGHWVYGAEVHEREFWCWLPNRLKPENIDDYIARHLEDETGFWVEGMN